jgi:hypothetical protein
MIEINLDPAVLAAYEKAQAEMAADAAEKAADRDAFYSKFEKAADLRRAARHQQRKNDYKASKKAEIKSRFAKVSRDNKEIFNGANSPFYGECTDTLRGKSAIIYNLSSDGGIWEGSLDVTREAPIHSIPAQI